MIFIIMFQESKIVANIIAVFLLPGKAGQQKYTSKGTRSVYGHHGNAARQWIDGEQAGHSYVAVALIDFS